MFTLYVRWSYRVDTLHPHASYFDESDPEMKAIDDYQPQYSENVEKSLTNLSVVLSNLAQQHEQLTRPHQVYNANFNKQQDMLGEEINLLRLEMFELWKSFKKGV